MPRTIYITNADKEKLQKLIDEEKEFNPSSREFIHNLEKELNSAKVVSSKEVPPDVITMNSKILLKDLDTDEEMTYTLVYPADADLLEDKISVLAPVGTALLGYKEGDIIDWPVPSGMARLKIEKILYQPEAAGDYQL
ncbi:nucleoside diphosphate kinase regulator [Desulfofalx alkaliphila]|uniref:nucleoside diphosphate kinase regulator n=1 Tax=Desulfofalx alkaliphila TaxID=105483 RepID=UPI0004E1CD62|nr:nucleoside diphosphate kinase regulator [Desulfofalx alkaliphila]